MGDEICRRYCKGGLQWPDSLVFVAYSPTPMGRAQNSVPADAYRLHDQHQ